MDRGCMNVAVLIQHTTPGNRAAQGYTDELVHFSVSKTFSHRTVIDLVFRQSCISKAKAVRVTFYAQQQ